MRRTVHKESWQKIAPQLRNLQKKPLQPKDWKLCRDTFLRMTTTSGKDYGYENCGRKPKLTQDLVRWMINRLNFWRRKGPCTAAMLQAELAKMKKLTVATSTVRKALNDVGYYYMPRIKKTKYNDKQRAQRTTTAGEVVESQGPLPAQGVAIIHLTIGPAAVTTVFTIEKRCTIK